MVQLELDRSQHLELMRVVLEIGQKTAIEVLATRGSRLALFHLHWLANDGSVGPSDGEFLMILEVDEAGGTTGHAVFDVDALDAAYAELDLRYAARRGGALRRDLGEPLASQPSGRHAGLGPARGAPARRSSSPRTTARFAGES